MSDPHQPYVAAVQELLPQAQHIRTGLHRACGETTKPIERSHIPTRDRLRSSRGHKTLATGQRFFEGFEALHALYHGHIPLEPLVSDHPPATTTPQKHARAVVRALHARGARMTRAASPRSILPSPGHGSRERPLTGQAATLSRHSRV